MTPELSEASATIFRLRSLHGVYERALMNAGDALVENVASPLDARGWFEALLKQASGELQAAGVFHGRWSLFSDDELLAAFAQLNPVGNGDDSSERDGMATEIEVELGRREIAVPA